MDSASQRPDRPRESDGVEPVLAGRTVPNAVVGLKVLGSNAAQTRPKADTTSRRDTHEPEPEPKEDSYEVLGVETFSLATSGDFRMAIDTIPGRVEGLVPAIHPRPPPDLGSRLSLDTRRTARGSGAVGGRRRTWR